MCVTIVNGFVLPRRKLKTRTFLCVIDVSVAVFGEIFTAGAFEEACGIKIYYLEKKC